MNFLNISDLNKISDLPKPREIEEIMKDEDFLEQRSKILMNLVEETIENEIAEKMMLTRINKFLADSGAASRRKVEELIKEGRVEVNGRVITDLSLKIDPEKDEVALRW
jgi:RNA-binding protein YlmH